MSEEDTQYTDLKGIPPRISNIQRFRRVFFSRGLVIFGTIAILAFIITAIFAPWIAPYDPYEQDLNNILLKPSKAHILGTDTIGRDTLSRLMYGARTSIMIGVVAVAISAVTGMMLGLFAGYFGGWAHTIIMRFVDALMSFPMILLALILASLLGGGLRNVMLALGIAMMSGYARVMCGQVLSVKQNDYVLAGRVIAAGNMRIMLRHVVPNCFQPIIVMMTMQIGMAILAEAGLSFLGIGIESPTPAWGGMVNDGYKYVLRNPILSFAPGLAIMLVVFAFNMVGDGLRDALDPRLRGVL
jgi:peptide/nickel transport system permease protein